MILIGYDRIPKINCIMHIFDWPPVQKYIYVYVSISSAV